ncbi:MAG: ribonuclease P protein component [Kiritimatiellales bacterium]|nr:ribonuclease P protein component [Kiritimatiellales bacterium]MCF7864591.1 ribonuclease P protein component [Kiritimatiellales bacterium]
MPKPLQRESDSSIDSSPPSSGLDRRLSAKHRLIRSALFAETFAQHKRWVGRYMVLWRRSGEGASLRLGVITSKKISLRANQRNRARRRLREAYRNLRPYFTGDFDVLLIGRRSILEADWKDILREMIQLARHAGLLTGENLKKAETEHGIG